MATFRSYNGVKSPVLALGFSSVMLYVVLLSSLQTVNAVINGTCNGTTNSVICTLEQHDTQPITYQVSVNSSSSWQNLSQGRAEIKDLSPGTYYAIAVKAHTQYGHNITRIFGVWTKPEKPGCVSSIQKKSSRLYTITFEAPKGYVSKYNFTIESLNGYNSIITNKTTISNVFLEPGKVYNFSITSYNGNNEPSEVTTCTNRSASEKASEVRNITITHTPCSPDISWSSPEHPNGKIDHYELSAKAKDANGECKWNCTRKNTCDVWGSAGTDGDRSVNCSTADFRFGDRMSARLLGLEPNTTYNVSIAAYNEAKTGLVATRIITTGEPKKKVLILPASVSNISLSSSRYVTSTNSSSGKIQLKIRWVPSTCAGNISYNVDVKKAKDHQSQEFHTVKSYKGITGTEIELDDVLAHWNYEAHVQTVSSKGKSSWVSSTIHTTAENNPGQVQNLYVVQDATYASIVLATFDCLNETVHNGILSKYVISRTFQSLNGDEVNDGEPREYPPNSCLELIDVTISEVEKQHKFSVKAVNRNYSGDYSEAKILTPKARKPHLSERFPITADVIETNNEGPNIKVKVCVSCLTTSSQGNVEHSGLTVCVVGDNNNCGIMDVEYHKFLTWRQAQKEGFTKPYRATPDDWKEHLRFQPENYTYEVGVDTNCDTNPEDQYCNGPLPEGKRVIISVVVCTKAGCEQIQPDAILVNKRPEKQPSHTVSITLGVLGALVLICVVAVLVRRSYADECLRKQ